MPMCTGISIFSKGGAACLHICLCRVLPVTSQFTAYNKLINVFYRDEVEEKEEEAEKKDP